MWFLTSTTTYSTTRVSWTLPRIKYFFGTRDEIIRDQRIDLVASNRLWVTSRWVVNLDFKQDPEAPNLADPNHAIKYLSLVVVLDSVSNGTSQIEARINPVVKIGKGNLVHTGISAAILPYKVGESNVMIIKGLPKEMHLFLTETDSLIVELEVTLSDAIREADPSFVIELEDVSDEVFKYMLDFNDTGTMAEEWKTPGKIEEVISVADRYQFGITKFQH